MIDRLTTFLVALSLAFLVWLYARSRDQEMLDNVPIPVQLGLVAGQADHYDLEVTGSSQVIASFTGPPSRIRELRGMLQRGELRVETTLTVPEDRKNEARYLDTVRIDASDLHPPPGVRPLVAEGRNRIPVTLRRIVERKLRVRVDRTPEEGVAQVIVEPGTVLVRGPQDVLDRARSIPTQPFALPPRTEVTPLEESVTSVSVPLVREIDGRPVRCIPRDVEVRLTIQPRQKVYELVDVPVQFLCPANFPLRAQWPPYGGERAGKITVRVIGPVTEQPPTVLAFIDLSGRKFEPGLYADEPLRLQLPKDFQLAQAPPRSATFQLVAIPAERPGEPPDLGGLRRP
jgi:hypothetical protein